ncbi:transketolase [Radiomyces spectabilis]|uniref:transketolase n=1 Tax=Radiomyces spectabilis TaxID=64574 RepID=UPI00221FEE81|nr:transketolase [Radiomyces spectabilis]KAI8366628.1 transketolase [Radiomyces spectabilis]
MGNSDLNTLCINTIRTLAADVVRAANSGHPGAPMGCAPMAQVLFSDFVKVTPHNAHWANRDRFVLSNGHACVLQYILLHLMGFKLSMDDLKNFRQVGSCTPGHPERGHTEGIEVTTGPLGQGIANAIGLAIAEENMAATFNKPNYEIFNNYTYCILGDGCMQEGVQSEACSLAGHLQLGKLIALYDDNHITIDGDTAVSFTEDVVKRFEAYGWHVQVVDDGDSDLNAIKKAIEAAKKVQDKPSLIKVRTTIGYGSLLQGEEKTHGSPLSEDDIKQLKKKFGFNPDEKFVVPQQVYEHFHKRAEENAKAEKAWNDLVEKYCKEFPDEGKELKRRLAGKLPDGWQKALPKYTPDDDAIASRKLSEAVINKLADVIPELIGGSADLTGSNNTRWKTAVDFQPPSTKLGNYGGRYLRYGIREHGMSAIMNGIAAYQGLIPFGGTFLNFLTYAWGAARLSALSKLRVLYIMTHDSIGLGEDGPTHQPIETLALTRATPNMYTFRPADGNETSGTYLVALERSDHPSVLALSRQNLPQLKGSSIEAVRKGGYVLEPESDENPDVIIVATGSEVMIARDGVGLLRKAGLKARLVSMPCTELFDEQSLEYRQSVLLKGVPVVSVEALSTFGWQKYSHAQVGMVTFGDSGQFTDVYKKFKITAENVAETAQNAVKYFKQHGSVPELFPQFAPCT